MGRNKLIALMAGTLASVSFITNGFIPNCYAQPKIDLRKVKKEESAQIQVVQNRAFTKVGRLKVGLFGGSVMTDPFLSVYSLGGKIGYSFSDFFSFQAIAWKDISRNSTSEDKFQQVNGFGTNSNSPSNLFGGEFLFSPVYGKLNFLNTSIIYYDLHVGAGLGMRKTASGSNLTYLINVGQDFFLSKNFTLEVEYRTVMFNQRVLEKFGTATTTVGQEIGKSFEISHAFTVGIGYLF